MKRVSDINVAKETVRQLLGKNVTIRINKGRNRVKNFKGVLNEAHPNVFVVELSGEIFDRISCSYTDMLCGEVSLTARP